MPKVTPTKPINILLLPSESGQDWMHALIYPADWTPEEADAKAIEAFTAAQAKDLDEWSWEDYEPELEARGFTIPNWHHGPMWDVGYRVPLPPTSRFWAQLIPGRMECPACSALIWFGTGGPLLHQRAYDRITSRLTCPSCHRVWTLGVIAWGTPTGSVKPRKAHPDQKLSLRQAATLRQYAQGFWADEKAQRDSLINRYLDGECCCAPLPWREDCPIHGNVKPIPE